MKALPIPVHGGSLGELRRFVNVASEDDWRLMVAWLTQALRAGTPCPIATMHGEQGSAKSTTSRVARNVFDPNLTVLRCEPREVRDLMIAATNSGCVAL